MSVFLLRNQLALANPYTIFVFCLSITFLYGHVPSLDFPILVSSITFMLHIHIYFELAGACVFSISY